MMGMGGNQPPPGPGQGGAGGGDMQWQTNFIELLCQIASTSHCDACFPQSWSSTSLLLGWETKLIVNIFRYVQNYVEVCEIGLTLE